MFINDDREGRKKRKYYRRVMKNSRNRPHRGRWLLAAGGLMSAAALLLAAGIFSLTSRALEQLTLVTNSGRELPINEIRVMDGAQVYVKDYSEGGGVGVFYRLSNTQLDTAGLDLSSNGEQYAHGEGITLNKSSGEGGIKYLYIQQKEGADSMIASYKVSFYDGLGSVQSTPATSDSQMTSVKVGDVITFASEGTMYYTEDGTEPTLVRDSTGSIQINGENFRLGSDSMKSFGMGNILTVTEDWLLNDTKTIRVISYKEGYDLGTVDIFRFRLEREQAKAPTISPVTTAENPVTVSTGTKAVLTTVTSGGVILYTTNGRTPAYSVSQAGSGYEVIAGADTYIYSQPISIEGEPDAEVIITAMTVRINTSTGVSVMRDSNPVQFVYKITSRGTASPPEVSPESGTKLALNSKIYLTTSTSEGVIVYTTDGSTPLYEISQTDGGYELVMKGTTKVYGKDASCVEAKEPDAQAGQTFLVQAKTLRIDMTTGKKLLEDSSVAQFSFQIMDADRVAAPTATPDTKEDSPTVVKEGSKIMLNSTTAGADIYYTMDGTAPVINSDGTLAGTTKLYSGKDAIIVPPAKAGFLTITAMARKKGMNDSPTVQFNYQYPGTVAPPYATPTEGTISINTEVTLASLDKNAQIYYTLDGTEPAAAVGRLYSEPILLAQDTIIKAICVVDGVSSAVRTFTFYVAPELMPPTPSIASGAVLTSGTTINLTAQQGAQIFYTLDGSSPKADKAMAGSTVTLTGEAGDAITLITYAKGSNYSDSQIATYVYTISNYENGIKANPEAGGKVKEGDTITLETDVTNGVIYYAIGGDSPDSNGLQGTQITVGASGEDDKFTLKATVVPSGSAFTSSIASFIYEYMEKPVAPKASIPNGAVLLEKQDVVLTADGGDIYYTLDETEPDSKSDIYTEPIQIAQEATIKAISISEEGAESDVATFAYTFAEQTKAPVFSIKNGEVESGTTLTITSATKDAVIYYTTDGQIPDLSNPKNLYIYSGAIVLNKAVNIKAMAVKDRMTNSEVSSAIYTVKEPVIIIEDEKPQEEQEQESGDRLMSRRVYMDEQGGPAYSDFIIKSAATGVVVSAEEGAIPAESQVEVAETAMDSALNYAVEGSVGKEYAAVASYDVSLVSGEQQVQPEGDVEIGLPVEQQYRNRAFSIAHVDEDGNVETYETRRDNDMAYAHVTHFGRYCIVAPVNFESEESQTNIVKVVPVMGAALLAAGYILLRMGRKKNKERDSILDD